MNKFLMLLTFMLGLTCSVSAAEGVVSFEAATSSAVVKTVALSTSAATLVSLTLAQSLRSDGHSIVWYSATMYNVAASTAVYAFGPSETVAPPEVTCVKGAPIDVGSETAPWHVTEQFQTMYLWGRACGSATNNIKVVLRGR